MTKTLDSYQFMRTRDLPLPEEKPEVDYEALCEGDPRKAAENLAKLPRPLKPPTRKVEDVA